MESLRKLAYNLDDSVANISGDLVTLDDVMTLMQHLREDMDKAAKIKEERLYFDEFHRTVRVLSELMYFLMKDIKKDYKSLDKTRGDIFQQVVNGEQEKTSTNDSEGNQNSPSN
mgnify:CR=1 FL=1